MESVTALCHAWKLHPFRIWSITHIKVLPSLWRLLHLDIAYAGEPSEAEVSVYLNSEFEAISFN